MKKRFAWWSIFFSGYSLALLWSRLLNLRIVDDFFFTHYYRPFKTLRSPLWNDNLGSDLTYLLISSLLPSLIVTLPLLISPGKLRRISYIIFIAIATLATILLGIRAFSFGESGPIIFVIADLPRLFIFTALLLLPVFISRKLSLESRKLAWSYLTAISGFFLLLLTLWLTLSTFSLAEKLPKFELEIDNNVRVGSVKNKELTNPTEEQLNACKDLENYLPVVRVLSKYHSLHCPLPSLAPPGQTNESQGCPTGDPDQLLHAASQCQVGRVWHPIAAWGIVQLENNQAFIIDDSDLAIEIIDAQEKNCARAPKQVYDSDYTAREIKRVCR